MTARFPLIFNPDSNQIQELPNSEALDLSGCGIKNAASIDVVGFATVSGSASFSGVTTSMTVGVNTNDAKAKLYVDGNSASNIITLTDGANIIPDFASGNNFIVTLGGNRTLNNPTGVTTGQSGVIIIQQDATGSRTLGIHSHFHFAGGTAPTLTTTANAVDVIGYVAYGATTIACTTTLDVKTTPQ